MLGKTHSPVMVYQLNPQPDPSWIGHYTTSKLTEDVRPPLPTCIYLQPANFNEKQAVTTQKASHTRPIVQNQDVASSRICLKVDHGACQ